MLATRPSAVLALVLVVGCRGEPSGRGEVGDADAADVGGGGTDADVEPGDADTGEDSGGAVDSGDGTEDEDDPVVAENRDPLCDDGVDNDLDGDVDCRDYDCVDSDACCCGCDDSLCVFRGGECVCEGCHPPERCLEYEHAWSYIRDVAIPPATGDGACCYDFDGDGNIDNRFAVLLSVLSEYIGGFDAQSRLRDAIARDALSVVFGWGHGYDDSGFWLYVTSNDLDGDGAPDHDFATRAAGDGVFGILPESVDQYGARTQFNVVTDDGEQFQAGPSLIRLSVPLDAAAPPLAIEIVVERATLAGEYFEDERGRWSVDLEYEIDGATVTQGGWKLGGFVPLDAIGAFLDEAGRNCPCAGLAADAPVVTYGDDGTRYNFECVQTPAPGCTGDDGVVCANIVAICELLPALLEAGINDVDMDGNGVDDSMSVGLWLSAVGATFSDPPLLPGE